MKTQSVVDNCVGACVTLQTGFPLCLGVNDPAYVHANESSLREGKIKSGAVVESSFNGEPWGVFEQKLKGV